MTREGKVSLHSAQSWLHSEQVKLAYMERMGERIRARRRELGKTQAEVAKAVGVSRQAVKNWEDGTNEPKRENVKPLCEALETNWDWLYEGAGSPTRVELDEFGGGAIPLISWVQAGEVEEVFDPYAKGAAERWILTTARVGRRAFALRVQGDSMEPLIPEGSIVVVDPEREPTNGSIVVARFEESNSATIKKLSFDGNLRYLRPINPQYKTVEITESCTIVGVAMRAEIELESTT